MSDYNLISDFALELIKLIDECECDSEDIFLAGRRAGLAEAASLLNQQARAFGVGASSEGLQKLSARSDITL
jgi:hypothetical protein